ncbi:hypothetical protein LJY18_08325 [Pseudomonas sp. MMS21-TM103]|uniref:hypothetical protein n=1 Tax=Pseudomonas sp. MMS21 TM103 TaxID=2886506 RepID=UPI001EDF604E|nr:hypothetical protein [Pseudomonas sp. MMS21 TM103]MCG4453313.1 hypothetical protein [Pseudomonas sp. MMS21 TM103]
MGIDTYLSKVKKLRQAASERAQRKNRAEIQSSVLSDEQRAEVEKLRYALDMMRGRDRVGVAGESAAVAGSAAAGAALAGSVAGAAGASTLLGSTTLAGVLGGVFVTATPVGWVLGSAVVAGALGYGAVKLVRSGGKQDRLRAEMSDRLNTRLNTLEQRCAIDSDLEIGRLIGERLEAGVITPEAAQRVVSLVEKGHLSLERAAQRLRAIDLKGRAFSRN